MTLRKKSQRFLTLKFFNQGREEKNMTETGRKLGIRNRSVGFNSPPRIDKTTTKFVKQAKTKSDNVWTLETTGSSNRNLAFFYNASPPRGGGTNDLLYNSQKSCP